MDAAPSGGPGGAARPADRVLLLEAGDPGRPAKGPWWELPGGGMEGDEPTAGAAARELYEETGIVDVDMGPCVWRHHAKFDVRRDTTSTSTSTSTWPGSQAAEPPARVGPGCFDPVLMPDAGPGGEADSATGFSLVSRAGHGQLLAIRRGVSGLRGSSRWRSWRSRDTNGGRRGK